MVRAHNTESLTVIGSPLGSGPRPGRDSAPRGAATPAPRTVSTTAGDHRTVRFPVRYGAARTVGRRADGPHFSSLSLSLDSSRLSLD
eukprot:29110-Hanusia_phi.AAC.1